LAMTSPISQLDFDPRSVEEFITLLRQELPFWEGVVERGQKLITVLKGLSAKPATSVKPRYQIWTGGECKVVEDISVYEKRKHAFSFWIDCDEKKYPSLKNPSITLSPLALRLLVYFVERLGKRVSMEQLLRGVWDEELGEGIVYKKSQQSKIEQQLTKLENFCGKEFRKYLFGKKFKDGIGLKMSLKDKYFIFKRVQ